MDKKHKFGIIFKRVIGRGLKYVMVCNCGQHEILSDGGSRYKSCKNCLNKQFRVMDRRLVNDDDSISRISIPYVEVLEKDNKSFKAKRTNISIVYEEGFLKVIKENMVRVIDYDIVAKTLKIYKNGKLEFDNKGLFYNEMHFRERNHLDSIHKSFFTLLDKRSFIDVISDGSDSDLYETAITLGRNGWYSSTNLFKGLLVLSHKYDYLQILASAGIPKVDRFCDQYSYNNRDIDRNARKPHKILNIPKFMIPYIREDISIQQRHLRSLRHAFETIDGNTMKEMLSIVKDEGSITELSRCIDTISSLHVDYGYKNIKRLILYIFRECRMYQGIDASGASMYLRDYVRMSKMMNLTHEQYPKSLKREHDIVSMNYNATHVDNAKKEEFAFAVSNPSYKELTFSSVDHGFEIVIPSEPVDIVEEGNELSHCVGSYVSDIIDEKCKIVFMRDMAEKDKPLITVEIRGRNIRQARGTSNRATTRKEREFISEWARNKRLSEAYY